MAGIPRVLRRASTTGGRPPGRRRRRVRLLALPLVMLFGSALTGCDSAHAYYSDWAYQMVDGGTPYAAWNAVAVAPAQRCGQFRSVFSRRAGGQLYFTAYQEKNISPTSVPTHLVNIVRFDTLLGPGYTADERSWNVRAQVKGCSNYKVAYGWILPSFAKVQRSVRCVSACIHGDWRAGWH